MVNVASVPSTTRRGEAVDTRRLRRVLGALALVAAPILVGTLRAMIPYFPGWSGSEVLPSIAAHLGVQRVVVLIGMVDAVAFISGILALTRLVSRRSPVLGGVGGALALAGWGMMPMLTAVDAMAYHMAASGENVTTFVTLYDEVIQDPTMVFLTVLFAAGHVLGTLLLGVAMIRTRVTAVWAGVAVIAGDLLHVVFALGIHSHVGDGVAFILLTIGFAAAAWAILATPDDDWDLSPNTA